MHVKKYPSESPVREPPLNVPPPGSIWREMLRLQSQWFIHSFISVGVPKKGTLPRNAGKTYSHRAQGTTRTEGLHTMGCGLVPQGDR
jgi:hypothetical protein